MATSLTRYTGFRPFGFREEDFFIFPIISLWQIMTTPGMATLDPRGMVGMIYEGDC